MVPGFLRVDNISHLFGTSIEMIFVSCDLILTAHEIKIDYSEFIETM